MVSFSPQNSQELQDQSSEEILYPQLQRKLKDDEDWQRYLDTICLKFNFQFEFQGYWPRT